MSIAVVDASAVVELLRRTAAGEQVRAALRETSAVAPARLDAEVMSALGRLVRAGDLPEEVVTPALRALRRAPIARVPLPPLLEEAWSLRANVTQRDALYVVLALRLDALLVTTDARLARAPSLDISVKVVDVSR
ncbi:MAG: type II toxin-antitoxin system VapC family toxin [Egibacteraceae bacterium]